MACWRVQERCLVALNVSSRSEGFPALHPRPSNRSQKKPTARDVQADRLLTGYK